VRSDEHKVLDLTIAIPVRNEEKNLPGCLAAIGPGLARRVVVIDSGSTDATRTLAHQLGAEVVDFQWNGQFPKKRNWYLRTHPPGTRWVLFLDADEYLTEEFKAELRQALSRDDDAVGYWLSYTIYFLGRRLRGGYPLRKLALFRVGAGEYERIDEEQWSTLDMEIHEHPQLRGPVGTLRSPIDHRDFRGVAHYVAKHNDYSDWEAARYLKLTEGTEARAQWTWKQRLKYRLMRNPLIGPVYFLGSFVLMGGFRDGSRGLAFAMLKAAYFTQVYCKIREREIHQT
jgi:glycosyltransferase involved in cell wall biosynthesis